MTETPILSRIVPLKGADPLTYDVTTTPEQRRALTRHLDVDAVRKLSAKITLTPDGKRDWVLSGHLGATVIQPCVVTLDPVTTRIDTDFTRRYVAGFEMPDASEAEMPDDDTTEALPESLDIGLVVEEALALALPDYPRADEAFVGTKTFAASGITPMSDEDTLPFAGLAGLRDKLKKDD